MRVRLGWGSFYRIHTRELPTAVEGAFKPAFTLFCVYYPPTRLCCLLHLLSISHISPLRIYCDDASLTTKPSRKLVHQFGILLCRGDYRDFVRTRVECPSRIFQAVNPPPTVRGMNTLLAVFSITCAIVSLRSCEAVMSRKISSSALAHRIPLQAPREYPRILSA